MEFLKRFADRLSLTCIVAILSVAPAFAAVTGAYVSHTISATDSNQIEFVTGTTQKVRIYVCTPSIVRISIDDRGVFTSARDVLRMSDVNRAWPRVSPLTVTDTAPGTTGTIDITTPMLKISVQKSPFRIRYFKADGTFVMSDTLNGMNSTGDRQAAPTFTFTQRTYEHYFGWGLAFEQFRTGYHQIDNKGQTYSVRRSTAFYMYSTGGYGIWLLFAEPFPNSSSWGAITNGSQGVGFDLRGSTAKYWMNNATDPANGGLMEYASYFFILGNWKEAMTGYTLVSGRPPRLGKKFYGYFRDMYFRSGTPITTFRGWISMFRSNRFNMDWIRMDNFFDWTNLGYLPSVPNASCWNNEVETVIQEYRAAGFLFGGMSAGWGYYGCCSSNCTNNTLADSAHCKVAYDHGFDFAWYDAMNYQARFQAQQQWDTWMKVKRTDSATAGDPETRVMISRGWQSLSSQAWPGAHMGDYLNQPGFVYGVFPSALQEHLVGYAFSHCDLGEGYNFGYMGYTLRPMVTIHMAGAAGGTATAFTECGLLDEYSTTMKNVMRKWGNEHYKFIPYLFSYGIKAHWDGIPPTRGMMCQNGGEADANTWNKQYQAYVGEELIWSPYYFDNPADNPLGTEEGSARDTGIRHGIYLPPVATGAWFDYYFGTKYPVTEQTGATINYNCKPVNDPMQYRLPVFVKAGAIIPLMDTLQYIGERAETLITIQVWPTGGGAVDRSGSFTLYEDEGTSSVTDNASKTQFDYVYLYNSAAPIITVNIGAFAGSRYCPDPGKRLYRVELHNITAPTSVTSSENIINSISAIEYHAGVTGWCFDSTRGGVCYVNASGNAATGFAVVVNSSTGIHFPGEGAVDMRGVSFVRHGRAMKVIVPFAGTHSVELMDLRGRLLSTLTAENAATHLIPLGDKARAVYMIRVRAAGKTKIKRVTH